MAFPWAALTLLPIAAKGLQSLFGKSKNQINPMYSGSTSSVGSWNNPSFDEILGSSNNTSKLNGIWGWIKEHPEALIAGGAIIGQYPTARSEQKLNDVQRMLMEQELRKRQQNETIRQQANQILSSLLSRGPYGM